MIIIIHAYMCNVYIYITNRHGHKINKNEHSKTCVRLQSSSADNATWDWCFEQLETQFLGWLKKNKWVRFLLFLEPFHFLECCILQPSYNFIPIYIYNFIIYKLYILLFVLIHIVFHYIYIHIIHTHTHM